MTSKQQRLDELLKARDRLDKRIRAITGPAVGTALGQSYGEQATKKTTAEWVEETLSEARAIQEAADRLYRPWEAASRLPPYS